MPQAVGRIATNELGVPVRCSGLDDATSLPEAVAPIYETPQNRLPRRARG